MTLDDLENTLIRLSNEKLIEKFMRNGLLMKEFGCFSCNEIMKYINFKQYKDLKCWRCPNSMFLKNRPRINIRKGSFLME
jgi:phage FluMu protein Com